MASAAFAAHSGASDSRQVKLGVPCAPPAVIKRIELSAHRLRLLVAVPLAGRLRAGGPGLIPARRRIGERARVWLTLRLRRRAAARLGRRGALRVRVSVRYSPTGWSSQTLVMRAVTVRA